MACVIYARVSQDDAKRGETITRHVAQCRRFCEHQDMVVAGVYTDNDIGASEQTLRRSKKPRPGLVAMLADLSTRQASVDAVVTVEVPRIYRQPRQCHELIDVAKAGKTGAGRFRHVKGVRGPSFDLWTGDGEHAFIAAVNNAAYESRQLSDRQTDKHRAIAAVGGFTGAVPFGYRRVRVEVQITDQTPDEYALSESATFKITSLEVYPPEADLVREAARKLIEGKSKRSLCLEWRQRGIKTPRGTYWQPGTLTRCLLKPSYAGIREHRPGGVYDPNRAELGKGKQVPALWPAILDEVTHRRLVAVLTAPGRGGKAKGSPARVYLLSGIAVCGVDGCGTPLGGHRYRDTRTRRAGQVGRPPNAGGVPPNRPAVWRARYECRAQVQGLRPAHLAQDATEIDDKVIRHVFEWLDSGAYDKAVEEELRRDDGTDDLFTRRKELEQDLDTVDADYPRRISARVHTKRAAEITAQIKAVDRLIARHKRAALAVVPSERGPDLRRLWKAWENEGSLGLERRRAVIRALVEKAVIYQARSGKEIDVIPGAWAEVADDEAI